MAHLGVDGADK